MSLEILQLEELQNLCKQLIVIQEKMQSNDKLIECLNIHYDLSKEDTNEILKVVIGKKKVNNEDEKELLRLITTYHIKGSYPPKDRLLPSREEIKIVLDFSDYLFNQVCTILNIDPEEVKK